MGITLGFTLDMAAEDVEGKCALLAIGRPNSKRDLLRFEVPLDL